MAEERYVPCYGSLRLRPNLTQVRPGEPTLTGDVRRHTIVSEYLRDEREVLVWLPPGFSPHDNFMYPTVYLQDGQNVFDASTAVFGVEWGVDEAAEQLIVTQKIRNIIMIAVNNSTHRIQEYTPFPDPQHGGGAAALYRAFLYDELRPFLEAHYPLSTRAEERAIIGSSLGGLLALYIGWTRPEEFGLVAALSPSLWWNGRGLITAIAGDERKAKPAKIWLDMGTEESDADTNGNGVPDVIDDVRAMKAILLYKGYKEDDDLMYREIKGGTHDEASWSSRIGEVLQFFFPKKQVFY